MCGFDPIPALQISEKLPQSASLTITVYSAHEVSLQYRLSYTPEYAESP